MRLPHSLYGRMSALLLAALIVAQVLSLLIFTHERHQLIENAIRNGMTDRATAIVGLLQRSPPEWRQRIVHNSSRRGLRFALSDHNVLGDEPPNQLLRLQLHQLPSDFRTAIAHADKRKHRPLGPDRSVFAMSLPVQDGQWLLAVKILHDPPSNWGKSSVLSLILSVLLAALVVLTIGRWITRPLAKLSSAAERLGRGEQDQPLVETGPEDIRKTTRAFNQMRERLERFVADRTRMLAAISHDLRTPITALRLRAEFIDDEENRGKILETLDEMQHMTEATLAFAKSEHTTEATQTVDITALLDALCEDYRALGNKLEFDTTQRLICRCRPLALKRALRNLIDNGLAYGSNVNVNLQTPPGHIAIHITDSGPGIDATQLERVFDPFVRLESSRNRDTGGIGLGLSIARTIVHAHGGDLSLRNRPQGGLEAVIKLPATHAT